MNWLKSLNEYLMKKLDWFISILPKPLFMFCIWLMIMLNGKSDDVLNNSNITTQNGKTVITRHDGHIFIDDRGIVTYEKTR